MRKIYVVIIALLLILNQSVAQTTYTWIGVSGGDYQVASNWSPVRSSPPPVSTDVLQFNAVSAIVVNNVPNQTIGAIRILSGTDTVSFATNSSANILSLTAAVPLVYSSAGAILAADYLTIALNNSAPFTMTSGTFGIVPATGGKININASFIISGGKFNVDVTGTGGTSISSTGSITYNFGTFACSTPSAIVWANGSNYIHNANGSFNSTIPASTWSTGAPGSTCTITGMNGGSIAPKGFDSSNFSNLTWNCIAQLGDVVLLPSAINVNINGTLTIASTGAKELQVSTGIANINAGLFSQTGGTFTLQAGAGTTTLSVSGNYSNTGGLFNGVGGGAAGTGTAIVDLKKDVFMASPAQWASTSTDAGSQVIFQFSGNTPQAVNISGSRWLDPAAGRCNIVNTNSSPVGINLLGFLKIINKNSSQPAYFNMGGIITGTGLVTYTNTGSGVGTSLNYNGSFFQTATAFEFPSTPLTNVPTNLTINNSLGVGFPLSFSRTITGRLSLLNGNLALNGNTLSLTNLTPANQLTYIAGFITTGTLSRYFPNSGLPTSAGTAGLFPFGTGVNDRSLTIYFSTANLSTGGAAGMINVTHSPVAGITAISLPDGVITLDKITKTNWTISTGGFSLGSLGETISLTAVGANIGSVDDSSYLRLTDGLTTNYGTLIPVTGSNAIPTVGKSGLTQANVFNKTLYIGSDSRNPLIIITFTWTGASGIDGDWTRPTNWTGGVGYPSASTEIAIISNSSAPFQPLIKTGTAINVYQLTVALNTTLNIQASAGINVFDLIPDFSGTAAFDSASTFGYSSSNTGQTILDLPYGNLTVSGTAIKTLAPSITLKGNYVVSGYPPVIGTGTFTYASYGSQTVAGTKYYNLTIKNNRSGATILLGNNISTNTIDVNNVFDVSSLSNYKVSSNYNTVNFSYPGIGVGQTQVIPGFRYALVTNTAGNRTFDPLGSTDTNHIIYARSLNQVITSTYTVTGSKVNLYVSGGSDVYYTGWNYYYNDLEVSGNLKNNKFGFSDGPMYIAGKYLVTLTNFQQFATPYSYLVFNGTGDQTINGYKTISATTPMYKYPSVIIQGGNRNVTFSGTDTVAITGSLEVPRTANYLVNHPTYGSTTITAFSPANGFTVVGSTLNFSVGSFPIPVLKPLAGIYHYNNIVVSGATHSFDSSMNLSGNLTVSGTDASAAVLSLGDGNNPRIINVLGNMTASGTGTGSLVTGQIDMNTGTTGSTRLNLGGNLTISGNGQLMGTTSATAKGNGLVVFNGSTPQTYNYPPTSTFKLGIVNFTVGDGTNPSSLTLASSMNLLASTGTSNRDTLTVSNNASLNCATFNLFSNGAGNAAFNLNAGATLITANTGGVEGAASNTTNGSIINDASMVRKYNDTASYTFNGITATPFSAASVISKMANLTIGANVTLDKSVQLSNTFTLNNSVTFALANSDLTLKSTAGGTARVAAVPATSTINYGAGTGRFNVERYYPNANPLTNRAWRLVTAPLNETGNIFDTWQLSGAAYDPTPGTGNAGRGTLITGPVTATNGMDFTSTNNYSLKRFINMAYVNVGDTKINPLSVQVGTLTDNQADNTGYFLFVRGDRNPALTNPYYSNTTTLSSRGRLQIANQQIAVNNDLELVGNPYASPIDFNLLDKSNNIYTHRFYVWDPNINQVGAFVTMEDFTTTGSFVPSAPGPIGSTQRNFIQSSQAFMVQRATTGAASLGFTESTKVSNYNPAIFRPVTASLVASSFRINLNLVNNDSSTKLADGTLADFGDNFSAAVDINDALKFTNINENFGFVRNGSGLSVERRPTITANDTLFFRLSRTTQRAYQFEFLPYNFTPGLNAFLEDNYTGTKTPVNIASASTFNFTINGDAKSAAPDRFRIVFKLSASGLLPVTFTSIKAYQQGAEISVDWTVENELNISKYEVEKSMDGVNFTKVNSISAKGANMATTNYMLLDANAVTGNNFYRILSYNKTGAIEYSRVVVVKIGNQATGISIYPNPVTGNTIGVAFNNMEKGVYNIRLINTLGQILMAKQLSHSSGNAMETLTPASYLSAGIYQLEVTAPDKRISTIKVIVQ